MMSLMTMILLMSDFIITSNEIYDDLNNFVDDFYLEAELIEEAKCELINFNKLEDMTLSRGVAYINETSGGYMVTYNGLNAYLKVENRMIIDYTIK